MSQCVPTMNDKGSVALEQNQEHPPHPSVDTNGGKESNLILG